MIEAQPEEAPAADSENLRGGDLPNGEVTPPPEKTIANPTIAIVGRPNVGKSTLLNRLAGRRISIVHPTPGVTRDRVAVEVQILGGNYLLTDTGGVGIVDLPALQEDVQRQIRNAIAGAQLILFVTDGRAGVHALDREVAGLLRVAGLPVLLVANKCEGEKAKLGVGDFYELGLGDPLPITAEHNQGITDLKEKIRSLLPAGDLWIEPALSIAIVGRRNAGKSTLINALTQEERVIVSAIPGTTRDAVDVRFLKDGREFILIDTAGIQRMRNLKGDLEYYAQVRSIEAIARADLVVLLLDAVEGVSQLDKRIASEVLDRHRACIIAVNKWDLAKERTTTGEYAEYLSKMLPGLSFAPIIFISARDAKNVLDVISLAQSLARQSRLRVGTAEVNRVLEQIRDGQRIPSSGGKEPKIFYGSQVSVLPPTIVLVVNDPACFTDPLRRFVEGRLREGLPFKEIPIQVYYRPREQVTRD